MQHMILSPFGPLAPDVLDIQPPRMSVLAVGHFAAGLVRPSPGGNPEVQTGEAIALRHNPGSLVPSIRPNTPTDLRPASPALPDPGVCEYAPAAAAAGLLLAQKIHLEPAEFQPTACKVATVSACADTSVAGVTWLVSLPDVPAAGTEIRTEIPAATPDTFSVEAAIPGLARAALVACEPHPVALSPLSAGAGCPHSDRQSHPEIKGTPFSPVALMSEIRLDAVTGPPVSRTSLSTVNSVAGSRQNAADRELPARMRTGAAVHFDPQPATRTVGPSARMRRCFEQAGPVQVFTNPVNSAVTSIPLLHTPATPSELAGQLQTAAGAGPRIRDCKVMPMQPRSAARTTPAVLRLRRTEPCAPAHHTVELHDRSVTPVLHPVPRAAISPALNSKILEARRA